MGKKLTALLLGIVCFVQSPVLIAAAEKLNRFELEKTGDIIWDVKMDEKVIALTFDDGPHPIYTPQILELLSKYNAKATFFVIGSRVEKYPSIVKREFEEGHEIANHTYSHEFKKHLITPEFLKSELRKTEKSIYQVTGQRPVFYRPVGGQYTMPIIKAANDEGYRVMMWSWHQDTEDWNKPRTDKIVRSVLTDIAPGNVILFHDAGGDRSKTVKALKIILPALARQGYEFVTLSELLQRAGIDDVPQL